MSILTVQIGQCGNQIGSQFFSTVASDLQSPANNGHFRNYEDECVDRFFSVDECGKWTARAVMVDTEPKVIVAVLFTNHFISSALIPDSLSF